MNKQLYYIILLLLSIIPDCWIKAQDSTVYDQMSLDELCELNVVVSASKKPEDLFDAPLSVTIIKKEDIVNAGCRNIMEALRLSPGLIVRETTPGNFDVHIRGFDDANKNFYVPLPFNSTILVMIDYRIVYSYFSGGTLWETLPIGIQDIERIEVVRGPAAALYGPNAVNGVINIITSQAKEPGLNTYVHAGIGTQESKVANTSIGYNWDDRTKINFSGNFSERNRFENNYYSWKNNDYENWQDIPISMPIMKDTITRSYYTAKEFLDTLHTSFNEKLSYKNANLNFFVSHNFSFQTKVDFSIGAHHSESQKPGATNFLTPFSENKSNSVYFDSHINIHNFSVQINTISGEDLSNFAFNSYKYTVFDASMEYNWQITPNLSLRPGINVRNVEYESPIINPTPFDFAKMNFKFNGEKRVVENEAFYFLSEWKPFCNLRFIGGIRIDTFSLDKTASFNYELGTTYRIDKNNLVRLVNSEASRAPFIFDTYLNSKNEFDVYGGQFQEIFSAQQHLKYPKNNTLEIGWRSKISSNLDLDLELFSSKLNNILISFQRLQIHQKLQLSDDLSYATKNLGIDGSSTLRAENYTISARQNGISFNLNYRLLDAFTCNIFATVQSTKILGYDAQHNFKTDTIVKIDTLNHLADVYVNNTINISDWSGKTTPSFYGGFMVNYKPTEKWNINMTAYSYSKQQIAAPFDEDEKGIIFKINPWVNINLKLSWEPIDRLSLYTSVYNILGKHREFFVADNIGTSAFIGVVWGF